MRWPVELRPCFLYTRSKDSLSRVNYSGTRCQPKDARPILKNGCRTDRDWGATQPLAWRCLLCSDAQEGACARAALQYTANDRTVMVGVLTLRIMFSSCFLSLHADRHFVARAAEVIQTHRNGRSPRNAARHEGVHLVQACVSGLLPNHRTSAIRPPIATCGGITLPSGNPVVTSGQSGASGSSDDRILIDF